MKSDEQAASKAQSDLAERLTAAHFEEMESMKRNSPWSDVPLWLWSPILSTAEVEMIARRTEELCHALLALGKKELRAGRAADWLPEAPGLLKSVLCDPDTVDPCFNWRFDFLWERESNRLSFLEVNAGDPSGLGWVAAFSEKMREHSLWRDFLADENHSFPLFESLQQATLERVGQKGHLCLVSADSTTVASDIRCLGLLYEKSGWQVSLADPGALEFTEKGCTLNGESLDLLFRDTYEELFWPPYDDVGEQAIQAQNAGRLLILNPLSASFWDCKSLWSELPSNLSTVPTTKILDPEMVEQVTEERERWVIKPSYDYGGRGVYCGYATDPGLWQEEVIRAAAGSFIAQERAPGGGMSFPFLDAKGEVFWEERFLTWSAWIHNGRFAGIYARASLDPVVNVHKGGAIFPVYKI